MDSSYKYIPSQVNLKLNHKILDNLNVTKMLKDILLPLETRRIKDVGSKQPGDDKEPTA